MGEKESKEQATETGLQAQAETDELSLADLPTQQYDIALVDSLASLHDASKVMRASGAQVLLVIESHSFTESRVVGVIPRASLANYYGM